MGITVSTNSVDNLVKSAIDVINNTAQVCVTSASGAQNKIIISGCTGNNDQIFINSQQIVSSNCITNASVKSTIASNVSQTLQQAAQAASQTLAFPSITSANNFITSTIQLGDTITNTFYNTCISEISGDSNQIVCQDSTLNNTVIGINSYQNATQQCILNSTAVSQASANVLNHLQESAVATQQNTFAVFILVFIAIIAILAWMFINLATDPFYQWLVVVIVLFFTISAAVYAGVSKSHGLYPYKRT